MALVKKSEMHKREPAINISKVVGTQRLMSVDPSINNLGMAIWDLQTNVLLKHELLHPLKEARVNEFDKSLSMLMQLKHWICTLQVNRMILEVPEHWSVGGFEAREKGSMTKLSFVCGMIYSLKPDLDELKVVVPRQWKGQLPKKVVENRLRDAYLPFDIDMTKINDNVMDAISIGHFYIHGSV